MNTLVKKIQLEIPALHPEDARVIASVPEMAEKFNSLFSLRSQLSELAASGKLDAATLEHIGYVGQIIINNLQKDINRYIELKRIAISN